MSDPRLTAKQIAELKRLWSCSLRQDERWSEGTAGAANLVSFGGDDVSPVAVVGSPVNLALIVALRNAAPALLAAAEVLTEERDALRAENERLRAALAEIVGPNPDGWIGQADGKRMHDMARAALAKARAE